MVYGPPPMGILTVTATAALGEATPIFRAATVGKLDRLQQLLELG
jgi:hypothetical protein